MPSTNSNKEKPSKTPTTIKLAAKEASQRNPAAGADPGPGDPSAAPSEAPQVIDLPDPPTPSELVVKSDNSRKSTGHATAGSEEQKPSAGYKSAMGTSKSKSKVEGSVAGPAASQPSAGGSAREPTSSRPLTGPTDGSGTPSSVQSSGSHHSSVAGSHHSSHHSVGATSSPAGTGSMGAPKSGTGSQVTAGRSASPSQQGSSAQPNTASTAMQADSGAVHDEDEEGEGEVEQPETPGGTTTSPGPSGAQTTAGGSRGASQADGLSTASPQASASAKPKSAGSSPASSPASAMPSTASSMKAGSSVSSKKGSSLMPSGMGMSTTSTSPHGKKDGKKVTKFRYHKRITVRTSGKTSPSTIMDKVNQKDHKAGITPSTIEDMDPQELMRRAGIKGTNKTHWRVRLRQTKRLTKNGKTVTQTKVAYRDSEGNKRIKTSSSPYCKTCGKKLEECKCESGSQS